MSFIHYEKEDADAKMPAASKPSAERSKDNWTYNSLLLSAGVTSPVQTTFQREVIEFPSTGVMARLSRMQYIKLSLEDRKLRENVNPGRPNAVFDLANALSLGISMDAIIKMTFEEFVERKVMLLSVNFSLGALYGVIGGGRHRFQALTKRDDVGTMATTIHRGCMVVVFSVNTDLLLSLEEDENAESRLAALRVNATDKANRNVFVSVANPADNCCLAKYSSLRAFDAGTGIPFKTFQTNASTLGKLGRKYGLSLKRLEDRSEYEALVPIENGTEEMKKIMAKNKKVSISNNPELKKKLEEHYAEYGEQAKDQKAFMNGIEKEYNYSYEHQRKLFCGWGAKKVKEVKKNVGDIKSFFTRTHK